MTNKARDKQNDILAITQINIQPENGLIGKEIKPADTDIILYFAQTTFNFKIVIT